MKCVASFQKQRPGVPRRTAATHKKKERRKLVKNRLENNIPYYTTILSSGERALHNENILWLLTCGTLALYKFSWGQIFLVNLCIVVYVVCVCVCCAVSVQFLRWSLLWFSRMQNIIKRQVLLFCNFHKKYSNLLKYRPINK